MFLKMSRSWLSAAVLAAVAFGVLSAAQLADGSRVASAKGKPTALSGAAAIALNSAEPHLGDWVTFTTSGVDAKSPRIQVMCYQGDVLVYGEAGPADQSFLLGGGMSDWLLKGGSATCTATVYSWDFHPEQTFVPYANVNFNAGGWR
jgi:hypothetical protein